ncbi:uncharacterized protein LOC143174252 [Nomia melanderi]|uniref:uncharacterized protein LOC143174252 n=1 Tax=Nomia melanderi TaxID=2448451 RepID=UPI003FCD9DBB
MKHKENFRTSGVEKSQRLQPGFIRGLNTDSDVCQGRVSLNMYPVHVPDQWSPVILIAHNFSITPKLIPREEIIGQVVSVISKLPTDKSNEIRRKATNILRQAVPPKPNITKEEAFALQDPRKNKDVYVLPADKGNTTVVMLPNQYYNIITKLLDNNTYQKLHKDPTKLYGHPKIHKQDIPLRPIVSAIGSLTYQLVKFLTTILIPLTGKTKAHIQNSEHFIQKIQHVKTNPSDVLGEYYEQPSGTAMGSPLSPAIANIFMVHLQKRILNEAPLKPSKWFRYADDTFVLQGNLDGTLGHQVYRKPTHTDRYLNASSHHHPAPKDSVIRSLVNRALKICDTNNLQAELAHVKHALTRNGFPARKIQRTVNRLQYSTPPARNQTDEPNNGPLVYCMPDSQGPFAEPACKILYFMLCHNNIKDSHLEDDNENSNGFNPLPYNIVSGSC